MLSASESSLDQKGSKNRALRHIVANSAVMCLETRLKWFICPPYGWIYVDLVGWLFSKILLRNKGWRSVSNF